MAYTVRQDVFREQVCSWLRNDCGGYNFDELSMKAWTRNRVRFEEHDISKELWYYDTAADNDDHALEWVVGDLLGDADSWADTVKVVVHSVEGKKYQERFDVPKDVPVLIMTEAEYNAWRQKVL